MSVEGKLLMEALNTVKVQLHSMKKCLDADQLMDALKAASTMLAELRTSSLSPKQYYELYMAVFDALRHLSAYLYDAHMSGKQHLSDLYELVQYAGNIVPRLYLMITVGTVYMSVPDAPIKEIMRDMMEMSRGVQHPTRGLFLRHYLSGMSRNYLPMGTDKTHPSGCLDDSIAFILTNFIEMNKLWVRLQYQGLSRDKERREMERKELRILVGTNLVRLSQLEGVGLKMYQDLILPAILEQVVNCKDVIAQEYLMEVVIQVFTDDFHLRTLSPFLTATAQLQHRVNIKQIVISLIDRLAAYAAREAESESPEEIKAQEEEAARQLAAQVKSGRRRRFMQDRQQEESNTKAAQIAQEVYHDNDNDPNHINVFSEKAFDNDVQSPTESSNEKTQNLENGNENGKEGEEKKIRGIPEDVQLFEVFWGQVVELLKVRPDLTIQDVTALLVSLVNLCLSCYPSKLEYVDQVLEFSRSKVEEYSESPDLHHPTTVQNLLSLLVAPINSYQSTLTLLALPSYHPLLLMQPFSTRKAIAHAVIASVLRNEIMLETSDDVKGILELCHVLVKDQKDAGVGMPMHPSAMSSSTGTLVGGPSGNGPTNAHHNQLFSDLAGSRSSTQQRYDAAEMAEEQGWLARMVHLFKAETLEDQFELLETARKYFAEGGDRIRWTFPPIIITAIKLVQRFKYRQNSVDEYDIKLHLLFRFIHQTISALYNQVESSEICLRLYLLALQAADEAEVEELAYEFVVQSFTIYEDSINDSKAQYQAISLVISALQRTRVFSTDNYDTLIKKATLHGAKLLRRGHQASAVAMASHLWWQVKIPKGIKDDRPMFKDDQRMLECLQKSVRIASHCVDEILKVQILVDVLDRYLYYVERKISSIPPRYINTLVELITSKLDEIPADSRCLSPGSMSGLIEVPPTVDNVVRHFKQTLIYIASRKEALQQSSENESVPALFSDVDINGVMLKFNLQPPA